MADLISRKALVTKLSQGYWDRNLQQAKNDPCVIDAMIDWAIRIVKEMPLESLWHSGTPTENGLYLVCLIYCGNTYYIGMHFNDGVWNDSEFEYGFDWLKVDILAWMPIEPYKEEEE